MHFCQHSEVAHAGFVFQTFLAVYIDPGSGGYYFQMLIAGLTTLFFFFSTIKRKVLSRFGKSDPPVAAPATAPRKPAAVKVEGKSVPQ